ncbi:FAD-dependent oxidoreductase [Occultella glacieicola]|uniref:FAD-dependent oxidoreductase n=1 Tax=Occultella glacieicola TaxID=2518684 RepID=A0ABY2E5G9_9MICO|nr:FAD-dependent oxidoreductase [Occultella glacieicola]TDE95842.1 FAD-dependent oxidoreductase [Occultella glacieicola]
MSTAETAGATAAEASDISSTAELVVIGGGVAGLVAAWEAARAGRSVTVLEAATSFGGMVGMHRVGGVALDAGAESFATRGGTVAALLGDLGLADQIVTPTRVPARVHHDGVSRPMPATGVLGIPTELDAPGLAEVLGADGLARARRDLELPVEVTGARPGVGASVAASSGRVPISLAALVTARMGEAVTDRLLRPVVRGVHSVEPEELAATDLLPGVLDRVAETGSLAAALAGIRAAAPAGSAVQGLRGGIHRLVAALVADLTRLGADLRTDAAVAALTPDGGGWIVRTASATLRADRVLLACAPHAWAFLRPVPEHAPWAPRPGAGGAPRGATRSLATLAADWPSPSGVDLVTLMLDASALPEHPRAGVLVAVPGRGAKALTYASAKWDWLGQAAGPDRAIIRLSYAAGIAGEDPEARATLALADAGRLLGITLGSRALVDHARVSLVLPRPVRAWGMSHHVDRARAAVATDDSLDLAGTWIAGTGLASVIADARAAGERVSGF